MLIAQVTHFPLIITMHNLGLYPNGVMLEPYYTSYSCDHHPKCAKMPKCFVIILLLIQRPAFAYTNAHKEITPSNSFYIFMQQGNLLHFKTCYITSVLLPTKCCWFHNFIFFCSNNTFFIK